MGPRLSRKAESCFSSIAVTSSAWKRVTCGVRTREHVIPACTNMLPSIKIVVSLSLTVLVDPDSGGVQTELASTALHTTVVCGYKCRVPALLSIPER